MARIFDCFTFYNELDLLEIRLEELYETVDCFVIVEASKTFSGQSKKLYFDENKDRFLKYMDKIIHVVVDDMPKNPKSAWEMEYFQRNAISRGLGETSSEDYIIISDVDEIPRAEAVASFTGEVGILVQKLYYYKLNCLCTLSDLQRSAILKRKYLTTPQGLRDWTGCRDSAYDYDFVLEAGWHFSFLGDENYIANKIESFAHQEYNTKKYTKKEDITKIISTGADLFGRDLLFEFVVIDESYPSAIFNNQDKFYNYIAPVVSSTSHTRGQLYHKTILKLQEEIYRQEAWINHLEKDIVQLNSGIDSLKNISLLQTLRSMISSGLSNNTHKEPIACFSEMGIGSNETIHPETWYYSVSGMLIEEQKELHHRISGIKYPKNKDICVFWIHGLGTVFAIKGSALLTAGLPKDSDLCSLASFCFEYEIKNRKKVYWNLLSLLSAIIYKQQASLLDKIYTKHSGGSVTVLMLSFNRGEQTQRCVEAVINNTKLQPNILIFDDASTDKKSLELIKGLASDRVKVIYSSNNLGPGKARNEALKHINTDYVLFLDNDVEVEEKYLEELILRVEQDENIAAACCRVIFPNGYIQYTGGSIKRDGKFAELILDNNLKNRHDLSTLVNADCDWLGSGATLVKRRYLKGVQFNEKLTGAYEDSDFFMQLKDRGFRLVNCPTANAIHHHIWFEKNMDSATSDYLEKRKNKEGLVSSWLEFNRRWNVILFDKSLFELIGEKIDTKIGAEAYYRKLDEHENV